MLTARYPVPDSEAALPNQEPGTRRVLSGARFARDLNFESFDAHSRIGYDSGHIIGQFKKHIDQREHVFFWIQTELSRSQSALCVDGIDRIEKILLGHRNVEFRSVFHWLGLKCDRVRR